MKRFLKIALFIILGIVVIIGTILIYFNAKGVPTYEVAIPEQIKTLKVEVTPERVARGEKIATVLCNGCHANNENRLVGKAILDLPAEFGKAYSLNITQDKEEGIGNWTDGEIMYFLKTGIKKNGKYSPIMPKLPRMADEDVKSVIAYLHSDRFPVQATKGKQPAQDPSLLLKVLTNTVMKPLPISTEPIRVPDSTNVIEFGKYVANDMIACYACHSKDFSKQDPIHPENSLGFYGGGNPMPNLEGQIIPSANITFDEETGIGKRYTEAQFVEAVKLCKKPDGGVLRYPMQPHISLSDYEVKAIYAYLKTIPKIKNKVN
ncbi:MAG: cytochrome c [Spirosomaceae bacterium]|jgi:mono/diheme cytochrome c family protein|nr:cytochrome c [Spirosomataceae bacterium]